MNRFTSLFLIILGLLMFVGCSEKNNSFTIESVDIEAQIQSDGAIQVTELHHYKLNASGSSISRSLPENAKDFVAFLAPNEENAQISTDKLQELEVERDDHKYNITTNIQDDSMRILYSYHIIGAITKYKDVSDLSYSFFTDNEQDMNNVTISLYTPSEQISNETYFFFQTANQSAIEKKEGGIHYQYAFVEASESYNFRLIFPATELSERPIDLNRNGKNSLLISASSLEWRYDNINPNFNRSVPFLIIGFMLIIIIGICLIKFHPNKWNKPLTLNTSDNDIIEQIDPLFLCYIANQLNWTKKAVIAGLFSLHQRGLVRISNVVSGKNNEETFRFTWRRSNEKLSKSDRFLKYWLFTDRDKQGEFFLLDSRKTTTKSEKKIVNQKFKKWHKLVMKEPAYQHLKQEHLLYHLFNYFSVLSILGFLAYFYFHDVFSPGVQYSVVVTLTVIGSLVAALKFHKSLLAFYYLMALILSFLLSMTVATIFLLMLIVVAATLSILIPRYRWQREIKHLSYSIEVAKHKMARWEYPSGNTLRELEKKTEYAIILGHLDSFVEQFPTIPTSFLENGNYPLLENPRKTAELFNLYIVQDKIFLNLIHNGWQKWARW